MLVLQQMMALFLVMIAGFFAQQKGILDESACKKSILDCGEYR